MKVKIVKCSGEGFWYKGHVDDVVEVVEHDATNYALQNSHHHYILKADCEIVVEQSPGNTQNKYLREIKPGVWVDIYDVLNAWKVSDPCLQHAAKKVLQCGDRGHKDRFEDLMDIEASIVRAIEMHTEWNK